MMYRKINGFGRVNKLTFEIPASRISCTLYHAVIACYSDGFGFKSVDWSNEKCALLDYHDLIQCRLPDICSQLRHVFYSQVNPKHLAGLKADMLINALVLISPRFSSPFALHKHMSARGEMAARWDRLTQLFALARSGEGSTQLCLFRGSKSISAPPPQALIPHFY